MSKRKLSTQEFILKASLFHNNQYIYNKVNYIDQLHPIIITCRQHGDFQQIPKSHLKYGCNKCAQELRIVSTRNTQQDIIKRFIEKHGNLYNYSKVKYKLYNQPVEIICKLHGSFFQSPHSHLNGNGCRKCVHKVSIKEIEWLDSLNIPEKYRFYKIVVPKTIYYVDGFDPVNNIVYEFNGDYWHGNPKKFESNDFNTKTKCTFGELYQKTLLKESRLKKEGYQVITKWETE